MDALIATILRPVAKADLDRVATIWIDGWLANGIELSVTPTYVELRERIAREIAGDWQVTVAEIDGAIAGFVAINPKTDVLEQIFVAPDFHRLGVGAALLAHARQAMPNGFTLWTHGENHGAAAFYERQGMALMGPGVHPKQGHPILTYGFGPVDA